MDEQARQQVALILEHATERAFREAHDVNQATLAEHSSKGLLQSGGTIKRAIKSCSNIAHQVLDDLFVSVAEVEKSEEAFTLLRQSFDDFLSRLESEELFYIARVASGHGKKSPDRSIWDATQKEFGIHKDELAKRLDLAAFNFRSVNRKDHQQTGGSSARKSLPKNKGGKPLAAHWDAMWAAMAVQLWIGDLNPSKQADIKDAMLDWFNANEIDVGDTAVTQRARQLWQAMQNADG